MPHPLGLVQRGPTVSSRTLVSRRHVLAGVFALCAVVGQLGFSGAPAQAAITHPYTGVSFGPGGVGSGTFGGVVSVAVDQPHGDVFVLDTAEGGRVYKFNSGGEPVSFSSSSTNVIEGVGSARGSEEQIAVDGSTGPDAGDIYVANTKAVEIYSEAGVLLGELERTAGGELCGVAVDSSGNVYVGNYPGTVRRYTPITNPVTNLEETGTMSGLRGVCNIAVDSAGDIYAATYTGGVNKYDALQFGSLTASGTLVDEKGPTLAVAQTGGEVLVDEEAGISQYDGSTEPPVLRGTTGTSGEGALSGSFGVAVDQESGRLYAADGGRVEIFGAGGTIAGASTEGVTGLTGTEATLHGTVEPSGTEVTGCVFEYGTEASALNQSAPCEPATPYTGSEPVAVTTHLTGLNAGAVYHYRIAVSGANGSVSGAAEPFTTEGPQVSDESFSSVGSGSASVAAQVNPEGALTSFKVEYGTTTAYGASTPSTRAGSSEEAVGVTADLDGLQPATAYHFRVVATNEAATTFGPDVEFTTLALAPLGLPDERGYELVSPPNSEDAQVYVPNGAVPSSAASIESRDPFRAAADGDAIAYVGAPNAEGNGSEIRLDGNEYLAVRNPSGGWVSRDIQPKGIASPAFAWFSEDLSTAVLTSREPLTPGPSEGYEYLYSRDSADGALRPLFTVRPPNRTTGSFGAVGTDGFSEPGWLGDFFAGASSDSKHLFFEANDKLTPEAVDGGEGEDNLYESFEGSLRLVNVLPDGTAEPNASFGSPPISLGGSGNSENSENAISADGSRVFWTDIATGSLYVREDADSTKLIAEEATFLTASPDGTHVLYTKGGDLYEQDLSSGATNDLASGGEVFGLAAASENLEYIYFYAEAGLTPGAPEGRAKLYLYHDGTTTLVATLVANTEEDSSDTQDWAAKVGYRTVEATPDGRSLVFMSRRSLTGYKNRSPDGEAQREVYVYEADSGSLTCVSCSPSGESPAIHGEEGYMDITEERDYQARSISADGGRVFFNSRMPLVPQDVDGVTDAYEWERDGTGSCHSVNGCIYLLSSGSSLDGSYFVDASANGSDAFIVTDSQLVPEDQNLTYDLYDVRVGAVEGLASPQCTGSGCQGVPGAPPVFATPSSVTFTGVGNFAPPAKVVSKAKTKTKPKAKKHKPTRKRKAAKKRKVKKRKAKAHKSKRGGRTRATNEAGSRQLSAGNGKRGRR
jgi:hypothetical protein